MPCRSSEQTYYCIRIVAPKSNEAICVISFNHSPSCASSAVRIIFNRYIGRTSTNSLIFVAFARRETKFKRINQINNRGFKLTLRSFNTESKYSLWKRPQLIIIIPFISFSKFINFIKCVVIKNKICLQWNVVATARRIRIAFASKANNRSSRISPVDSIIVATSWIPIEVCLRLRPGQEHKVLGTVEVTTVPVCLRYKLIYARFMSNSNARRRHTRVSGRALHKHETRHIGMEGERRGGGRFCCKWKRAHQHHHRCFRSRPF